MENLQTLICPLCKSTAPNGAYFCQNCGKALKPKPLNTTFLMQVFIYCVSFFLPPFGLYYSFKYIKEDTYESRKIAFISAVLTFVSIAATLWLAAGFINSVYQSINTINSLGI